MGFSVLPEPSPLKPRQQSPVPHMETKSKTMFAKKNPIYLQEICDYVVHWFQSKIYVF